MKREIIKPIQPLPNSLENQSEHSCHKKRKTAREDCLVFSVIGFDYNILREINNHIVHLSLIYPQFH